MLRSDISGYFDGTLVSSLFLRVRITDPLDTCLKQSLSANELNFTIGEMLDGNHLIARVGLAPAISASHAAPQESTPQFAAGIPVSSPTQSTYGVHVPVTSAIWPCTHDVTSAITFCRDWG